MAEIFQGAGWQTDDFLDALKDAEDLYCERLGFVKLDSWSRGRVTLVGDAAYCPSASTGMGTTSGIVGAYVLAGEIGRHCGHPDEHEVDGGAEGKDGLPAALKAYERKFRPFVNHVQRSLKEGKGPYDMMPSSAFGIGVLHFIADMVSLLRLNVIGGWILREKVEEWTLPEYQEMLRYSAAGLSTLLSM